MRNIDLLKYRVIIIDGDIDDSLATEVINNILSLFDKNPKEKIYVLIDSNGGQITSAMAIYDVINYLSCEIITIALKNSSAIATLLLATGSRGKRYAFKNSEIRMGFNLYSNEDGVNNILEENFNRIGLVISKVIDCYAKATGLDKEKLTVLCNVNNILSIENIIKSNLVDEIIASHIDSKSKSRVNFITKIKDRNYYEKVIRELENAGIM
ncbi:ATP-dependent Clp protease proteolytic subunit [Clostridium hydrogeniformans]|uniref:ATP-dependent Clp protease proteolytic subunit n=1 Tax=Clostridium hydrogeniformans TaxID=349933 RepID=UPI00047F684D|nr:ATP-dependent Clp protease proteolytic subunit [Clostridium hydrogeniformans]